MVQDLQNTSTSLIYQREFSDYNLKIGDNILSQHWGQKTLQSSYLNDGNTFRYFANGVLINIYKHNTWTYSLYLIIVKSWIIHFYQNEVKLKLLTKHKNMKTKYKGTSIGYNRTEIFLSWVIFYKQKSTYQNWWRYEYFIFEWKMSLYNKNIWHKNTNIEFNNLGSLKWITKSLDMCLL